MRRRFWPCLVFLSGLIVIVDEVLKNFALKNFPAETEISEQQIIALAVHKNFGIAFDLPVWLPFVLALSFVILLGLIGLAAKNWSKEKILAASALVIALGATGNLFDRLVYGFTVDYIIFPTTGSAFNFSDVIIIFGLLIFIWNRKQKIKV